MSDQTKVSLYLEPKSATPLALLSLCLGALAIMYMAFVGHIQATMEDELGYDPDGSNDELLELVYGKANKAWWMFLSAGAISLISVLLIFGTATFLKGPVGKVCWIIIVLSYLAAAFFFGWGAGLLLQPISDLSDAIDKTTTKSAATSQQLSNIKASFKLIGSSAIVLVVISVLACGVSVGIKKSQA